MLAVGEILRAATLMSRDCSKTKNLSCTLIFSTHFFENLRSRS